MVSGQSRRGQNAASAAILVALVGGALILYILMLPPAERERLLFSDGGGAGAGGGGYGGGGVFTQYGPVLIFQDTPGTLRAVKSSVSEHNVPSATIYTAINTQEVKFIDSAVIKNGVFARRALDAEFYVNRGAGNNYLLSFNVDEAGTGRLRVILNGHLVYERPVRERSPSPIPLPSDYIVDGENHIIIESDDPGFAFWRSNTYVLHNILVSADMLDDSSSVVAQQFTISEEEFESFESAQLQFVPDCNQRDAGRLIVQLNSKVVRVEGNRTAEVPMILYSGLPDCGVMFKTDVSKDQLRQGENTLIFASQDGQYVIDRIKLLVRMKQNDYPVYYFNLPREMYDTLDAGDGQLRLTITFTDYRAMKSGEIVVNGFVQSFNVQDYAYQAVLDPGILTPGPNTLQIIPHIDRLDVAEVKIELV